jgi:predicted metal-dependent HD superfamily phosphohydrolase
MDDLRIRFDRAVAAAGATRPAASVYEDLSTRYGEPHRCYHTLAHVDACLVWLDWFCASAEHPEEVELALWFHDAVYAVEGRGNEQRSAALARDALTGLGIDAAVVERVARHIEATETHVAASGDAALVVDLDLTVLGARPRDFDAFERRIRHEYAHVPECAFRMARRGILEGFLARPEIYTVPVIRAELEAKARANLARRIGELSLALESSAAE